MKEEPKVLTRMRLSCCWGDNLNEKELNEVVDYINNLQSQLKAKEEVIKEAREYVKIYRSYANINGIDYLKGRDEIGELSLDQVDNLLEILSKGENK